MGFFDSKSKSLTSSQNQGLSEVDGPATSLNVTGGSGKNSTTIVNALDGGAVQGTLAVARDLGLSVLDLAKGVQESNLKVLDSAARQSADSVAAAYGLANSARQSETSGAINNFLKYAAIIAGLGLGAWVLTKAR